ncbi:unnamed protein product [Peronospora farinosa]|nr:unnamed protein product [Peronospora farinosa]
MLPDPVVPGVALASAPQPPTSHQARRLAVQDPTSASPGPQARRLAAEDLAIVVSAPGRAAGMLPDPVVPGEALAAATARALGVAHGPSDLEGVLSDDEDALEDPVDAASPSEVLASVLPSPERAGGMLADQGALACLLASSEACMHDGPATPPSTAVAMDVDEGALWTAPSQHPLSPPRELRVAGKRRRLNDVDDEDQRELAELSQLVDEDEAGIPTLALRPSAASTIPASVLSVFVHNAQHFQCTLCTYTAASFASLTRHRVSRHRRIAFMDRFSAGCACGTPFTSRLAAATHAQACTSLPTTILAAASSTGGASSHTVVGATATVSAVAIVVPALPHQDVSEPTASPPARELFHRCLTGDR